MISRFWGAFSLTILLVGPTVAADDICGPLSEMAAEHADLSALRGERSGKSWKSKITIPGFDGCSLKSEAGLELSCNRNVKTAADAKILYENLVDAAWKCPTIVSGMVMSSKNPLSDMTGLVGENGFDPYFSVGTWTTVVDDNMAYVSFVLKEKK